MRTLADELTRCRKWIEDALEYSGGTHDFIDIAQSVTRGEMQLWCGENGAIVTEIVSYPKKKVLHIFLAGGEMDQILDMEASIIKWGQLQGCSSLTLAGRKGWVRALANRDWKHAHTVLAKEI